MFQELFNIDPICFVSHFVLMIHTRDIYMYCSRQFFFLAIPFNVLFKIISLTETSQSIGGAKREYPGKTI